MKKIINGKSYNTETATLVDAVGIASNVSENLYITKNGNCFLCGCVESNTKIKRLRRIKDNRGVFNRDIQAITKEEALAWCEKNSDTETIEKHFSEIVEEA